MSRETLTHLNTNVLIGNTDQRGHAWHYKIELQGDQPNHYPGFIPVADVQKRLFHYQAVPRRVAVEVPGTFETMSHFGDNGEPLMWAVQKDRQAIARDDNDHVMGVFKDGYRAHQLGETLIGKTSNIVGDTLGISSAGVLKGGAVGWVEVSISETQHLDRFGIAFRPNLLCGTSFDGSVATFWKRTITDTVCDNTFEIARSINGQVFKIKHSRNSGYKVVEAREALHLIGTLSEEWTDEVTTLVTTTVTDRQWFAFLDELAPTTKDNTPLTGRALTSAIAKQDSMRQLWNHDARVSPWKGTAWGVLQAVNTWGHHVQKVRGATRQERNDHNMVTGAQAKVDNEALSLLDRILANA